MKPELFRSRAEHDTQIEGLVSAVAKRQDRQLRLSKTTSNLFRQRSTHHGASFPAGDLNRTISIDPKGIAQVQGMTTFVDFADACLQHGFVPPVVPELKTITVGGAAAGIGIESSSFKRGFVHESIEEMDILCGDGQLRTCRPDGPNADLFYAFPNSYGTLGYAVRLCLRLEPTNTNVKLAYHRFQNPEAFLAALDLACRRGQEASSPGPDYVEAVAFAPDDFVLSTGWRSDETGPTSPIAGPIAYYQTLRTKRSDLLTARDHLWRWDADWFWCSRSLGFQNPWLRTLVGKDRLKSATYWKILAFWRRHRISERVHATKRFLHLRRSLHEPIIQDVQIPIANSAEFLRFYWHHLNIRPLWICPVQPRPSRHPWTLYDLPPTLHLNFGFWSSVPTSESLPRYHFNQLLEREVVRLGGRKSLYSTTHFEPDEFWNLYNGSAYAELKTKYDPQRTLPDLYEKAVKNR